MFCVGSQAAGIREDARKVERDNRLGSKTPPFWESDGPSTSQQQPGRMMTRRWLRGIPLAEPRLPHTSYLPSLEMVGG